MSENWCQQNAFRMNACDFGCLLMLCGKKSRRPITWIVYSKELKSSFSIRTLYLKHNRNQSESKTFNNCRCQNIFLKILAFHPRIINHFTSTHTQFTVIHELSIHLPKVTVLFRNWSRNRSKPSLWMSVRECIKGVLYGGLVYLFKPQVKFLKADLSFKYWNNDFNRYRCTQMMASKT